MEESSTSTLPALDPATSLAIARQYAPCLTQLQAIYPNLPGAERRLADFILANPSLVLRSSVTALAQRSSVGIGTVARLCSKLGYGGFPDMKIALAVELLSPASSTPEPLRTTDPIEVVLQKVLHIGAQSLLDTVAAVDPAAMANAAGALMDAHRVEIYAAGALSGGIAQIARRRLLTLGLPCAICTQEPDHVLTAALLEHGDVALGLSNSGEAPPVVGALRVAKERGVYTIGITSAPQSSLAKEAEVVLHCAFRENWFQGDAAASRIGMLGVVDALYASALLITHRERTEPNVGCSLPP